MIETSTRKEPLEQYHRPVNLEMTDLSNAEFIDEVEVGQQGSS